MNKSQILQFLRKEEKLGNVRFFVNDFDFANRLLEVINSKQKADIQERKTLFMEKVAKFTNDYPREMLREFFDYWSEHGENDRKFRMEKEKSFDISKRLARWAKNSKFSTNAKKQQTINRQTEETIRKNSELISTEFIDRIKNQNKYQ